MTISTARGWNMGGVLSSTSLASSPSSFYHFLFSSCHSIGGPSPLHPLRCFNIIHTYLLRKHILHEYILHKYILHKYILLGITFLRNQTSLDGIVVIKKTSGTMNELHTLSHWCLHCLKIDPVLGGLAISV